MNSIQRGLAGLVAAFAVAGAQAATVFDHDYGALGALDVPGSISASFEAGAGAATVHFDLAGYGSLDGAYNCCSDMFALRLNGEFIYVGLFNLGGGGSNQVLQAPLGASTLVTTFGATDDPHQSTQVTWAGGSASIVLPVMLGTGANTLMFSYFGGGQGLQDEGWGLGRVQVTTPVPEPGTALLTLSGLAAAGFVLRRRRDTRRA